MLPIGTNAFNSKSGIEPLTSTKASRTLSGEKTIMSASDVLKAIDSNGVKFVDLRFTDTRGKEQHVSLPVSQVDEDMFEEGKMFDGSSIAGWKDQRVRHDFDA